jgi:hypothetical protein
MGCRSGKQFRAQSKPGDAALANRPHAASFLPMITVTTCSNLAEAELLHSLLNESGIEAFVLDDAFGGAIRVQVAEDQAEAARVILEEAQNAAASEDDDDEDEADGDVDGGKSP